MGPDNYLEELSVEQEIREDIAFYMGFYPTEEVPVLVLVPWSDVLGPRQASDVDLPKEPRKRRRAAHIQKPLPLRRSIMLMVSALEFARNAAEEDRATLRTKRCLGW